MVVPSHHVQVTMWMAFAMVLCYLAVYSTVLVLRFVFRDAPKKSYEPKQPRKQASDSPTPSRQKTMPESQEEPGRDQRYLNPSEVHGSDSGNISKPL